MNRFKSELGGLQDFRPAAVGTARFKSDSPHGHGRDGSCYHISIEKPFDAEMTIVVNRTRNVQTGVWSVSRTGDRFF